MIRAKILLMLIVLIFGTTSCSGDSKENGEDEVHSIEVYGVVESEQEFRKTKESLIFSEKDIDHIDWEYHKIYFTNEFLSNFDPEKELDEYNPISVDGLRIFSDSGYNMFKFVVDGTVLFEGYFPVGLASSFMPIGYVMEDEVDGVRFSYSYIEGESKLDDEILIDAFSGFGFIE